jgi:hypothetical protein
MGETFWLLFFGDLFEEYLLLFLCLHLMNLFDGMASYFFLLMFKLFLVLFVLMLMIFVLMLSLFLLMVMLLLNCLLLVLMLYLRKLLCGFLFLL